MRILGGGDKEFLPNAQLIRFCQVVGINDGFGADIVCGCDRGKSLAAFDNVFVAFLRSATACGGGACGSWGGAAGDGGGQLGAEGINDFAAVPFARGVECAELSFQLCDALLEGLDIGSGGPAGGRADRVHIASEAFDFEIEAFHAALEALIFFLKNPHIRLECGLPL